MKLTERQKELLNEFASSEHFRVLKDVVIPNRQDEIAKNTINLTNDTSLQQVHQAQGALAEFKWLVNFIKSYKTED